jgi:Arc/MetJ-type ribon-helix-helix transcriptional regulator
MTETITVRLSEAERKELRRHGRISEVVREAIRLYLRTKNSKGVISRLKELQKTVPHTSIEQDLELIRADRER